MTHMLNFVGCPSEKGSSTPQEWPSTANIILPDLVYVKPVITLLIGAPDRRESGFGSLSIPRILSVWVETGVFQHPSLMATVDVDQKGGGTKVKVRVFCE